MKYFITFMILIFSVNTYANIPIPTFKSLPQSQSENDACIAGVKAANTALAKAQAVDRVGTQVVTTTAAAGTTDAISGVAGTNSAISNTGAMANSGVAALYKGGLKSCVAACDKAKIKNVEIRMQTQGREISDLADANSTIAKEASAACEATFAPKMAASTVQGIQNTSTSMGSDAAREKALADAKAAAANPQEESWFQRNGAYVVGAGLVGVGAMALLSNSGNKSGQQQQQNSPSSSPSPAPAAPVTAACTNDSDYNNSACTDTIVTSCTNSNNAGTLCASFANYYCGLDDASDVTPSGSSTGNKTTYCRSLVSTRFCAASTNSACASCEYLAQQSKDICKTNPTLCVAQNTPAQIAAKQASCPADPLYADNSILQGYGSDIDNSLPEPSLPTGTTSTLVSTNPSTTPTTTTPSTTPTTTKSTTGTTVFTGKYTSAGAKGSGLFGNINNASSSVMTASSVGSAIRKPSSTGNADTLAGAQGNYATASAYMGAASEVTQPMGRNLFDKNSKTMNIWCQSVQCRNIGTATAN